MNQTFNSQIEDLIKYKAEIVISRYKSLRNLPEITFEIHDSNAINANAIITNEGRFLIRIFRGFINHVINEVSNYVENTEVFRVEYISEPHYVPSLLTLGLDFILEHEISHIINGHLGFKSNGETLKFQEMIGTKSEVDLDQLTMEWDADCTAVSRLVSGILLIPPQFQKGITTPNSGLLGDLAVMVSILFRAFWKEGFQKNDWRKLSHPPFQVRQNYCVSTIGATATLLKPDLGGEALFKELWERVTKFEMQYRMNIGEDISDMKFLGDIFFKHEMLEKMDSHWKSTLRSCLLPYALIPLVNETDNFNELNKLGLYK